MNAKKLQHNKWDGEVSEYLRPITWCEKCGAHPPPELLDKAHRLKRRFIGWETEFDKLEYFMAAKLCRDCHKALDEALGDDVHKFMFVEITEIILDRDPGNVNGAVRIHPFHNWDPLGYEQARWNYGMES